MNSSSWNTSGFLVVGLGERNGKKSRKRENSRAGESSKQQELTKSPSKPKTRESIHSLNKNSTTWNLGFAEQPISDGNSQRF